MNRPYKDEEIVQLSIKVLYCQYAALMLRSLNEASAHKTKEENLADHFHTIKAMFYNESLVIQFAEIISFFYKNGDQVVLSKLNSTPDQLKGFRDVRGAVAHIVDFEEQIKLIEDNLCGEKSIELLKELDVIRNYIIELLKASDPFGAEMFIEQHDCITKKFLKRE